MKQTPGGAFALLGGALPGDAGPAVTMTSAYPRCAAFAPTYADVLNGHGFKVATSPRMRKRQAALRAAGTARPSPVDV